MSPALAEILAVVLARFGAPAALVAQAGPMTQLLAELLAAATRGEEIPELREARLPADASLAAQALEGFSPTETPTKVEKP